MKLKDIVAELTAEKLAAYKLYEGLIYTHDINRSINMIKRFHKKITHVGNRGERIVVEFDILPGVHNTKTNMKMIKKLVVFINNLGWFVSKMNIYNAEQTRHMENKGYSEYWLDFLLADKKGEFKEIGYVPEIVEFILEAKFDLEVPTDDILYHTLPTSKVEKVMKIGLVPKHHSKLSYHPDRVYLAINPQAVDDIQTMFKSWIKDVEYSTLKIDRSKIGGLKTFVDPNFDEGVYTHQNIPPKAITDITKKKKDHVHKVTDWM